MTNKCIIFDTDGTTSRLGARRDHLLTNNWAGFFNDMHLDEVWEHTILVMEALRAQGYKIVIVTARPDDHDYKQKTIDWYTKHGIAYDALYMRKSGDYRKDAIVKEEILGQMLEDGWEPILAFDDRKSITDLWRSHGIPCMQVNEDDTGDSGKTPKYAKEHEGRVLLHMMVGPSGAGKSTYIKENLSHTAVISSDAIREQLFGSYKDGVGNNPDEQARVWSYLHAQVKTNLEHGVETTIDATSIRDKSRKQILELLPKGVLCEYVVICRNYDDMIKTRDWRPEWLIDKHYNTFKSNIKNILKGDSHPYVIIKDARQWKF